MAFSILPDDGPASMPSLPTLRGGGQGLPPDQILGRIDQYDLVKKLGGGGFGVVYLARDTVSGVDVALKTLHPLLKHNAEEMDSLREKFALVARLTHQGIAKALVLHRCTSINLWDEESRRALSLSPGDSVMVMDFAPGVTLSRWRRQFSGGVVPPDKALEIARQVASALDYAHSERIVHRDVKPANIMVETLTPDGGRSAGFRVRLLDFGLAAEIRSSMSRISAEQGDTSGTRPYMAPEQWLGRKQDGRTDQYALACVLYELLSGAPPFAGVFETDDPAIMKDAVVRDPPEAIAGLDPCVNEALLRALSKVPTERFGSCAAFVESCLSRGNALPEAQGTQRGCPAKTHGNPGSETRKRGKVAPSRRGRFLPLCVAVAAAAAAGVFFMQSRRGAETDPPSAVELAEAPQEDNPPQVPSPPAPENPPPFPAAPQEGGGLPPAAPAPQEGGGLPPAAPAPQEGGALPSAAPESVAAGVPSPAPALPPGPRRAGDRKVVRVGAREMALRWCPPGAFEMGSPESEEGRDGGESRHRVTLTKGFWMGETEVTQGMWKEVAGNNPSLSKAGDGYPVENVSWDDCRRFVESLGSVCPQEGMRWALPTEAQWEYACRAGTGGAFGVPGGGRDAGWHKANSGGTTHLAGLKGANAWGLRDMHGNVFEWCADLHGGYPSGAVVDPAGAEAGTDYVYRGGSFKDDVARCRSAFRGCGLPGYKLRFLGLRVALVDDGSDR